jgi:hypothetical protein
MTLDIKTTAIETCSTRPRPSPETNETIKKASVKQSKWTLSKNITFFCLFSCTWKITNHTRSVTNRAIDNSKIPDIKVMLVAMKKIIITSMNRRIKFVNVSVVPPCVRRYDASVAKNVIPPWKK